MLTLRQKQTGFTIVELLIVIVVIAIIATVSIVAYRGVQERAQNTKTISAVREWSQALRMYKAEYDEYPVASSCLGSNYGKGFTGEEVSGGECRQDTATAGINIVNAAFMNTMSKYISGNPTPAFVVAGSPSYPWYRGAMFVAGYTGTKDRIDFVLAGSSTDCPAVDGLNANKIVHAPTNSVRCIGFFPDSKY